MYIQLAETGLGAQLVAGAWREQAGIGDQITVGPGTPMQQQAGGVDPYLQQAGLAGARQHRLHHVLHLGERADLHQITVGGLAGKILLAILRQPLRIDEALLQLQRLTVGLMDDEAVKDGRPDPQPQLHRHLLVGGLALQPDHPAAVLAAPLGDLVGDVANGQQRRLGAPVRHEAAGAGGAHQPALGHQFAQRLVDRHPAHGELLAQGGLGRDPVARLIVAFADPIQDVLLDLQIEGRCQRNAPQRRRWGGRMSGQAR